MRLDRYRRVLSIRAAREVLLLGTLLRVPIFATYVVLTLHVVTHLGRSYAAAGLVSAASTICIAISGPWRGRLLDRLGLRRVMLPSLVILTVCGSIGPFAGYWPLLGIAALTGLFAVPTFSIIRQAMIAAVPEQDRRTALALDSVAVEASFMVGPLLGVWAATTWSTTWVFFTVGMAGVLTSLVLWIANPAITPEAHETEAHVARGEWFGRAFLAVCAAGAAATVVLSGTDIAIVAALRHFGSTALIGPILAVWGLGSMIGGLIYGALHRSIPVFVLLAGLSLTTAPIALARDWLLLSALTLVAGMLCAPTITATVDQLSRIVPATARGEVMGWHGSAMTAGSAFGSPIAGVAIDHWGPGAGFVAVALVGLAVAALGSLAVSGLGSPRLATSTAS